MGTSPSARRSSAPSCASRAGSAESNGLNVRSSDIESAIVWTRDQNPVITAKSEQANVLKSEFKEQELVGQENRFNGKGKLRILSADHAADKRAGQAVGLDRRLIGR